MILSNRVAKSNMDLLNGLYKLGEKKLCPLSECSKAGVECTKLCSCLRPFVVCDIQDSIGLLFVCKGRLTLCSCSWKRDASVIHELTFP
jgi:hypothetical protein